jgi:hypothetical protein
MLKYTLFIRIHSIIFNHFLYSTSEQLFYQIKICQYQLCRIKLDEQVKRLILFFSCIKLPLKMAGWKLIKTCFLISVYDHGPKSHYGLNMVRNKTIIRRKENSLHLAPWLVNKQIEKRLLISEKQLTWNESKRNLEVKEIKPTNCPQLARPGASWRLRFSFHQPTASPAL